MITVKLIDVDCPTINGRIYSKTILEEALTHWERHFKTKTMPIFKAPTTTPKEEDIVGYAENFRFEGKYLVADIGLIEEKVKDVLIPGERINIRPNGTGIIDDDGVVQKGYRMIGLFVRHQKAEDGVRPSPKPVVGAVIYEKN